MPGSILRPNGLTPGFGFILTGTKRAGDWWSQQHPHTPPPPLLRYTWYQEWVRQQSRVRKTAQSASMNAYQRSSISRDLDAASARICRGRGNDEGSSFSDWEDASFDRTPVAATPVQGLRVWAKQHDGIPPRSQIHNGANWKKSQEHRLLQGTRVVVSRCNSHSRVISQHQNADKTDGGYNSYQGQPVTAQGFGVGMTAGSQQWQGGSYFWRNDGWWCKDSEADELGDNQPAAQDEAPVGGGMAAPAIPGRTAPPTGRTWRGIMIGSHHSPYQDPGYRPYQGQ